MKSAGTITKEKLWSCSGIFVGEDTFRFHCRVLVDGVESLCYMPSNCKLGKIVSLVGREVYLKKYEGPSEKFEYVVQAVKFKNAIVLINLNYLNRVVEKQIHRKIFDFLEERKELRREFSIGNYKSDFWINSSNTIIEVKSVLSWENIAGYPIKSVERSISQLDKIMELLKSGYRFYYLIFSLSPYVREIHIDNESRYGKKLQECQKEGLEIMAFTIGYRKDEFYIKKQIPIMFN